MVGQYVGNLSNAGEQIELVDALGNVIQSFEYTDEWFDLTDGMGFSLTASRPADHAGQRAWQSGRLAAERLLGRFPRRRRSRGGPGAWGRRHQ